MSQDAIRDIVRVFLGNPFDVAIGDRKNTAATVKDLDVGRTLATLVRQDDIDLAKELILAVGHMQACQRAASPDKVLDAAVLPPSVAKSLPRPRGDYLRIAMAAGRCYRALSKIRGDSSQMVKARRDTWAACFGDSLRHALELERVIRDHDVLILGETGTGKEAFAVAIQAGTPGPADGAAASRSAINAAAIPDTLVESELFGHVKGAFTGATETRAGRLRSADGGSFFLDEVGDLPSTTQVKLLRVIETNEVYPVGSDSPHNVDVRYIAATHKDLESMVDERQFRRDLFERMAGNVLRIPPLRDRPDDIVEIGRAFVRSYLEQGSRKLQKPESVDAWLRSSEARKYAWPGNVRELQNALRNLLLGLEPGLREDPPRELGEAVDGAALGIPDDVIDATASMQQVSDWYMRRVLGATDNNYTQSARILGIDRSTVRRRIKALKAE